MKRAELVGGDVRAAERNSAVVPSWAERGDGGEATRTEHRRPWGPIAGARGWLTSCRRPKRGLRSAAWPPSEELPSNIFFSDAAPFDSPVSHSENGRSSTRPMRPVPVWRVTSSCGTAEPVRMNWPGPGRSLHSRRTLLHRRGAFCHSSSSRGVGPFSTSAGSDDDSSAASSSSRTSLRAKFRAFQV